MPSFLRLPLRLTIILTIIFFAIQPYNFFCQVSNSCEPFYFSYYFPRNEGKKAIDVDLEILNQRQDLEFRAETNKITTASGRKNSVSYYAKNISDQEITFRPILKIEPQEAAPYITRYQCLCFHSYKLAKGEEIELKMKFILDEKMEDVVSDSALKIRYEVK